MIKEIRLIDYFEKNGVVLFRILVITNNESFYVVQRYSYYYESHQKFRSFNSQKSIPELPPKSFFNTNDPVFLEQRAIGLGSYFTTLIKFS